MEVRAVARNAPGSARKIRPIIDLVRGKKVEEALSILQFVPSPKARLVAKVIKSAAANAEHNYQIPISELRIKHIVADEGIRLKRWRPKARGRVNPYCKHYCHITVVVGRE